MTTDSFHLRLFECPLNSVVVHQNGARISRSISITPTSTGDQSLVIDCIPASCKTDSIRVTGTGGCRIDHISCTTNKRRLAESFASATEGSTHQKALSLLQTLKDLSAAGEVLEASLKLQGEKKRLLEHYLKEQLGSDSKAGFAALSDEQVAGFQQLLSIYESSSVLIHADTGKLQDKMAAVKTEVTIVIDQLSKLLGSPITIDHQSTYETYRAAAHVFRMWEHVQVFTATVALEIDSCDSPIELCIDYIVGDAGWGCSYDARAEREGGSEALLQFFGIVTNRSGEDWANVPLSLSTAEINRTTTIPSLGLRKVGFKEPPSPAAAMHHHPAMMMRSSAPRRMLKKKSNAVDGCMLMESAPCAVMTATVEGSGATVSYRIPETVSIPTGSENFKVTISELQLPLTFVRRVVPSASTTVFLQGEITNNTDYTLLPCDNGVSVFLSNGYVGKASIAKRVSSGEAFSLSMGSEPHVSVDYSAPKTFEKTLGYVNRARTQTHEEVVALCNQGGEKVRVVVVQQYPLTSEADIVVKLTHPSSQALKELEESDDFRAAVTALKIAKDQELALLNKVNNNILQVVTLPEGGQKVSVKVTYTMEWPQGKQVEVCTTF